MRLFFRFFATLTLCASFIACDSPSYLEKRLLSTNDEVRQKALMKLSKLPTEKKRKLLPPLLSDLKSPDSRVVNRAVDALVAIGIPAVDGLRAALKDPDIFTRLSAVAALGWLGPNATSALPDLLVCLTDPHPLVREETAHAIGEMGQTAAPEAAAALFQSLYDGNEAVRLTAAEALTKLGIPLRSKNS